MTEKEMWKEYKKINPKAEIYDAWCFGGNTPDTPNELAQLVLTGVKQRQQVRMIFMLKKTNLYH